METTTVVTSPPAFPAPTSAVDTWVPEILAVHPHDAAAFTQGLLNHEGVLYESTGINGRSTLRRVDLPSGDVLDVVAIGDEFFGEGLERVDSRLIQLTWLSGTALVWDLATFDQVGTFAYDGEGWGLCDDGSRLVMSNGSADLTFRDRATFEPVGVVTVTLDGEPVPLLNELECVDDLVFANVWKSEEIVVIDPATGDVTAVIDASQLVAMAEGEGQAVLNGIAYDEAREVFQITGKLWDELFEVRFVNG